MPNQKSKGSQSYIRVPWFGKELLVNNRPETRSYMYVGDVEILLPVKFYWIPFSSCRDIIKVKLPQPIVDQGGHFGFPIGTKTQILLRMLRYRILTSLVELGIEPTEMSNISANQKSEQPSWSSDRRKNTNVLEGVDILLSFIFHWIPFSDCREEVKPSQSEAKATVLVFRTALTTQTW